MNNFLKRPEIAKICAGMFLVFSVAVNCGGSAADTIMLDYQTITPAFRSAIGEKRFVTIRDDVAWDALWREHAAIYSPLPSKPPIDFLHEMVIGIFIGSRSNGCYGVSLQSVAMQENPSRIEVAYKETTPQPGRFCTMAIVIPSILITIPASPLPVEFIQVQ